MFRVLASALLKLMGWNTRPVGAFPVKPKKCVLIVAPHTSSWDFIIGVLYRSVLRLNKSRYLGKAELFKPPFGFIFRWLGGTPVDRSTSQNMVDQVAQLFDQDDELIIALSPEGTRKRVDRLRTGFYNIAKKAMVPIVMVGFDFKNKQVIFAEPFYPSGDQLKDFDVILKFLGPVEGKYPEKGLKHLIPA
ncbi:MAG: 1-acyl-sn-glycerol-3-phosphate acyltransferase [Cyclobacteriaceae bacterium]|nr:1-acyl-sn-glycerol-3-phosphate acyltransferase [Cyclobacteriaceae bacterium]